MDRKLEFSIQTLLSQKDGEVSGPMSPFLFAQEMSKKTGLQFNLLGRVWFPDETVNQIAEGELFTGHDTLIIGHEVSNDLMLSLWVDIGIGGIPIAMAFRSDREVLMTKIYFNEPYVKKLTEAEVVEIFDSIFSDPGQLAIIQK